MPAITKIFESLLGKSVSDSVKAQVSAATMATTATVVAEMTGAPFLGAGIIRRRSSMEPVISRDLGRKAELRATKAGRKNRNKKLLVLAVVLVLFEAAGENDP